jgi:hypothetical protein
MEPALFANTAELMSTQKRQQFICDTRTVTKERIMGSNGLLFLSSTPYSIATAMNSFGTLAQSNPGFRTCPYFLF